MRISPSRGRGRRLGTSRKSLGVWPRIFKWRCVNILLHVFRSPQKGNGGKIGPVTIRMGSRVRDGQLSASPHHDRFPHFPPQPSLKQMPATALDLPNSLFQPPRQARPSTRLLIQMRIEFSFKLKGIWVYKRPSNACGNSILTPTI